MKAIFALAFALLAVLVSGLEALPEELFQKQVHPLTTLDHAGRFKRFTCDVLSATVNGNSFNHAPCATLCLAVLRGYKGGFCDERGVCNCRL